MKADLILAFVILCAPISLAVAQEQNAVSQDNPQIPAAPPSFYHNLQYGFCFRPPWSYLIVDRTWSGTVLDTQKKVSGPELLIRSRDWTPDDPFQDIPIMIFTPSQWKLVEADKLSVSAAPIGPSELGRNKNYVFALPPRWIGFTDAKGQDEVQALMSQHPFEAPCKPIVYRNTQYGFCFLLPTDWKGYKIVTEKPNGTEAENYPELIIRNPRWTQDDPWQDIPIMIFTPRQWKLIEDGDLIMSTGGPGPFDIGRNSRYVFALPSRWIGYTDAEGQDELQTWMGQHPLQAPCATTKSPPAK
jgi:hypothetical protein